VKTSAREVTETTIGKAGKNPGFSMPQVATIQVILTKILQITLSRYPILMLCYDAKSIQILMRYM